MELASGKSLRLLDQNGLNQPSDTPYEVGGLWELRFTPSSDLKPPHVEDVVTSSSRFIRNIEDVRGAILKHDDPWTGNPNNLFGGLIRFTASGSGYISEVDGIPERSTGYWESDRDLTLVENRYAYPARFTVDRRLSYKGVAVATTSIPAGTLVRVSLARWWSPQDADDDFPERCYAQLSGWFD